MRVNTLPFDLVVRSGRNLYGLTVLSQIPWRAVIPEAGALQHLCRLALDAGKELA